MVERADIARNASEDDAGEMVKEVSQKTDNGASRTAEVQV